MNNAEKVFIFDFDSTFIQVETIDILAELSLANHPDKKNRLQMIDQITKDTMEGRYSYTESLKDRFALLDLKAEHVFQAIVLLKQKITPSFARNRDFFKTHADQIYIFSGALIEIVWPIVREFGLKRHHVFANRLMYDFEGNVLGYDQFNPLAQDQGKVKLAHQLKLTGDLMIIGDGYNDYELKESGLVNTFIAFTENVHRKSVADVADGVISELEGLFLSCNIPYNIAPTRKKVLLVENIHADVVTYFKNHGYDIDYEKDALKESELIKRLQDVQVLGIRSKTKLTQNMLSQCPQLEAIGAFCIGTNQIDLPFCSQTGIGVFNAPFSNTRSVVELTLAEIIMLVRQAARASHGMMKGKWVKSSLGAHEVRGKTLGIIGYGHIGSQLSILAESLGMKVIYYDLDDKLALGNAKACKTLEECLSQADVITVHIDGRKENNGFISAKTFAQMKTGVIFLNLSRDFVLDQAALAEGLRSGKVAGAGIDVFPQEPEASKAEFKTALQEFDNVILTPHIGGSTEEAQQSIGEYVSKNLHAYLSLGSTTGSVNFPQLYLPSMHCPQRIIHIHHNVPGILAQINGLFARSQSNIEGQFLKTSDHIGYVITDINRHVEEDILNELSAIPDTIKVRSLDKN